MELKVWVEGIQRVVCGVTDSSTCQDVVYALAHATGQTGRFTLVEKWRNSERLLAPHEQPLKVLMKWGEYANDVHFVMRKSHTEANSKLNSQPNTQFAQNNNKRQHDFLQNFTTNVTNQNQKQKHVSPSNKEIKKSLTFSCSHASSGSVSSENSVPVVSGSETSSPSKVEPPPPPPSSGSNMKSRDGKSRQDLPKGVVRGIPQRPRDSESPSSNASSRIERPKHPPPYDEAVSGSSGRFAPSHLSLLSSTNTQVSTDEESPSSKRRHLATTRSENPHQNNNQTYLPPRVLASQNNRESNSNTPEHIVGNTHLNTISTVEKSPNKQVEKTLSSPQRGTYIEDIHNPKSKKSVLSLGRLDIEKHISNEDSKSISSLKTNSSSNEEANKDPQYQDLMRLVSLQREKLDNQKAELMQFDAEIVYWESKLQEQEEKLRVLQEEVARLERLQHEQDGELVDLDRRPFNEEVELGRQEERTLRSELTLARSQLANCETELLQCHQRIRLILEEVAEERRVQSLKEEQDKKELEQQESLLQQQLQVLQQQLKEKTTEAENQKSATNKVREELQELEYKIASKQQDLEKLMEDIRKANLYSLSLIPAEDNKFIAEGSFCNRPGSTRKIIGSPRQLENAVPTNKNPHGVWV